MAPDPVSPVSADSVPPAPPTVSPGLGLMRTVARLLLPVAVVAAVLMALVEALVGQRWQAEAQAVGRNPYQYARDQSGRPYPVHARQQSCILWAVSLASQ